MVVVDLIRSGMNIIGRTLRISASANAQPIEANRFLLFGLYAGLARMHNNAR